MGRLINERLCIRTGPLSSCLCTENLTGEQHWGSVGSDQSAPLDRMAGCRDE